MFVNKIFCFLTYVNYEKREMEQFCWSKDKENFFLNNYISTFHLNKIIINVDEHDNEWFEVWYRWVGVDGDKSRESLRLVTLNRYGLFTVTPLFCDDVLATTKTGPVKAFGIYILRFQQHTQEAKTICGLSQHSVYTFMHHLCTVEIGTPWRHYKLEFHFLDPHPNASH